MIRKPRSVRTQYLLEVDGEALAVVPSLAKARAQLKSKQVRPGSKLNIVSQTITERILTTYTGKISEVYTIEELDNDLITKE